MQTNNQQPSKLLKIHFQIHPMDIFDRSGIQVCSIASWIQPISKRESQIVPAICLWWEIVEGKGTRSGLQQQQNLKFNNSGSANEK
jgi:hypothetical protein